jgi:murein tripeptide amidase MpaA
VGTTIDIGFPGGSIQVVRLGPRGPIELALEEDSASTVRQWFAFRVEAPLRRRELLVVNASDASFPGGWPGYRAMASTDGRTWYRAPTEYAGGALSIRHEPRGPSTLYAYFATYAPGRVDRLLAHLARTSSAEIAVVGATAMGRALPVVRLGTGPLVVPRSFSMASSGGSPERLATTTSARETSSNARRSSSRPSSISTAPPSGTCEPAPPART